MHRVTKAEIRDYVEYLRKTTNLPLSVGWAYGRPRVSISSNDLSPRLPTGQLADWLNAFAQGYSYGKLSKSK